MNEKSQPFLKKHRKELKHFVNNKQISPQKSAKTTDLNCFALRKVALEETRFCRVFGTLTSIKATVLIR